MASRKQQWCMFSSLTRRGSQQKTHCTCYHFLRTCSHNLCIMDHKRRACLWSWCVRWRWGWRKCGKALQNLNDIKGTVLNSTERAAYPTECTRYPVFTVPTYMQCLCNYSHISFTKYHYSDHVLSAIFSKLINTKKTINLWGWYYYCYYYGENS